MEEFFTFPLLTNQPVAFQTVIDPGALHIARRRQFDTLTTLGRAEVPHGIYIVMIGVGAFLEKPALKGLTATQLNALMGIAMTAVAGIALAVRGPRLPMTKRTLGGLGVGVMIGAASVFYFLGLRGLPVSVASAASNASVVVTVVLSAIFLHQPLGRARGAAVALTLLGATLLALSTG